MSREHDIVGDVARYYGEKIREHGSTARGVDWSSEESQFMRFRQLCKVIEPGDSGFSLLDYGCGFGSLLGLLREEFRHVNYTGLDIAPAMLAKARELFKDDPQARWISQIEKGSRFDYVLASGIFNVRMEYADGDWLDYITKVLQEFHVITRKGFAFNILTKYSDKEYMRDYLYYADPGQLLDYCKKNFSQYVAVLHDYPLYEFTVLVKKYS